MLGLPTAQDFTPAGATIKTPTGREIFISDIGNYKLRMVARRPFIWTSYDRAGNKGKTFVAIVGTLQPAITNAFYSKALGKVIGQFDIGSNDTRQAEITPENFDLAPLDTLPTATQQRTTAQQHAQQVKDIDARSKAGATEQVLMSLFGTNYKTNLLLTVAAIIVVPRLLK
jgi:hypothetical protein